MMSYFVVAYNVEINWKLIETVWLLDYEVWEVSHIFDVFMLNYENEGKWGTYFLYLGNETNGFAQAEIECGGFCVF